MSLVWNPEFAHCHSVFRTGKDLGDQGPALSFYRWGTEAQGRRRCPRYDLTSGVWRYPDTEVTQFGQCWGLVRRRTVFLVEKCMFWGGAGIVKEFTRFYLGSPAVRYPDLLHFSLGAPFRPAGKVSALDSPPPTSPPPPPPTAPFFSGDLYNVSHATKCCLISWLPSLCASSSCAAGQGVRALALSS